MDPNTGKLYSEEEAKKLPKEIQDRLVPAPRTVKRRKNRKAKTYDMPAKNLVEQRRKASKQAKQARKKNRK